MKTLIEIENAVCEVFGVTPEFIHKKDRADNKPLIRYIIGYLFFEINGKTFNLTEAAYFCSINRCTLIHGMKVVNNELDSNPKFKSQVIEVFKKLGEKTKLVDEREEVKDRIKRILKSYYYLQNGLSLSDCDDLINLIEKL
jgi:hypothetical protein